jgi:hypothetical protein
MAQAIAAAQQWQGRRRARREETEEKEKGNASRDFSAIRENIGISL